MSCPSTSSSDVFIPCHSAQRDRVWTQADCETANCCWLSTSNQPLSCYQKGPVCSFFIL